MLLPLVLRQEYRFRMIRGQKPLAGILSILNKLNMKTQNLVFVALLLLTGHVFGQKHELEDRVGLLSDLFDPDSRTNMTFIFYTNCPTRYTNVVANTNLFTPLEQTMLKEVVSKYKTVTTNSGPVGTVLNSLEKTNDYYVAHFSYTNLDAHEDIIFGNRTAEAGHNGSYDDFIADSGLPLARYRTAGDGNGYDVTINPSDGFSTFAQIKHGKVNGLYVMFQSGHCKDLLRFADGKAVDKWLEWDIYTDNRLLEVEIKSSLDYFKYMTQRVDM
jgi:hypothetical protein